MELTFKPYIIRDYDHGLTITKAQTVKTGKKQGEVVEVTVGYYGSLRGALERVLELDLQKSSDITSAKALLAAIEGRSQSRIDIGPQL